MKRIIFSIYTGNVNEHTSVSQHKRDQFVLYKDRLEERQKQYAKLCGAEYHLFNTNHTDYDNIQFEKILLCERLTSQYDEVLYLDFDVVPATNINFFDRFNLDTVCVYSIPTKLDIDIIKFRNQDNTWHTMDMYSKSCCKKAMLLLNDIDGSLECFNTGVFGINKVSAEALNFSSNLDMCNEVFQQACKDNLYPAEMYKNWRPNNEVYTSFLCELNNVPMTNIGLPWNFILDNNYRIPSRAAHIYHCVNKDFNVIPQLQSQ